MKFTHLDAQVFEAWQKMDPEGWKSILAEIISAAMLAISRDFPTLKMYIISGENEKVSRLAHSLKSTCGNAGIREASTLFKDIEKIAPSDPHLLPKLSEKVSQELDLALPELQSFLKELGQ